MANPVCTLLRKCLPKQSLPIPSLNHPLSFTLPSPVEQTTLTQRSSTETCDKLTSECDVRQTESDVKQTQSPSTSQPLLLSVVTPDLSHTTSSCPNFPTLSPRSSSSDTATQSINDHKDSDCSQETLNQNDSLGKEREVVVMVPQVTEESNGDERQGDAERWRGGAAWFIGMTPLECSPQQQQQQDCDDEKEEEPVDLSQFDVFFPELKQVHHTNNSLHTHLTTSLSPPHTHIHTHTHYRHLSPTHTHTIVISLPHTHTHYRHLSPTHTHTHTHLSTDWSQPTKIQSNSAPQLICSSSTRLSMQSPHSLLES